jgi:EF hand domain-containing protein
VTRLTAAAAAALCALAGPAAATAFAQADINKDGVVEYWEAKRVFPRLAEVHFRKCDPNGDGVIEKNEFPLLNNFYQIMYVQRN